MALINDHGRSVMYEWLFFSMDLTDQMQNVVVNDTVFTSRRTSAQHSSPLVSMLTINNVHNALNMTQTNCTDIMRNMDTAPSTIAIHVISKLVAN